MSESPRRKNPFDRSCKIRSKVYDTYFEISTPRKVFADRSLCFVTSYLIFSEQRDHEVLKKVSLQPILSRVRLPPRSTVVSMSQPPIGDYGSSSSTAAASPLLPAVPSGDGMLHQQQQQPTPGAHDANHGGSAKMNQLLDANYLGVHTLAVGQVKSTEFTRQINARGLNKVKLSIKTKGWVNSNTPYVLVPHEQLPSGKDTVFSPELLGKLTVYCLDGNHRIQALLELEGAEFSVDGRTVSSF